VTGGIAEGLDFSYLLYYTIYQIWKKKLFS